MVELGEDKVDYNAQNISYDRSDATIQREQSAFLSKVHTWMLGGLLTTALSAWYVADSGLIYNFLGTFWFWGLIIAQFALVIGLNGWIEKMSAQIATLAFLGYSLLTGITLSVIFITYDLGSIYTTFIITAGMFAGLSAYGYFTKRNLSAMGSFMVMGLFGVIIMTILNFFIQSSAIYFLVNIIGIIVFSGLTAYDTQKIKDMYVLQHQGNEFATKGAILGALALYLDFINLFLFLLRFLGSRD